MDQLFFFSFFFFLLQWFESDRKLLHTLDVANGCFAGTNGKYIGNEAEQQQQLSQ